MEARILLLREFNPPLPASTPDSDPALKALGKQWKVMMRAKCKDMLIDEEVRRRKWVIHAWRLFWSLDWLLILLCLINDRAIKMNLANEGLEARKKEEEITSRKRKAEEDKTWEGTSDYSVEFFQPS
jgi:DnaJ homolog subfamily C member 8